MPGFEARLVLLRVEVEPIWPELMDGWHAHLAERTAGRPSSRAVLHSPQRLKLPRNSSGFPSSIGYRVASMYPSDSASRSKPRPWSSLRRGGPGPCGLKLGELWHEADGMFRLSSLSFLVDHGDGHYAVLANPTDGRASRDGAIAATWTGGDRAGHTVRTTTERRCCARLPRPRSRGGVVGRLCKIGSRRPAQPRWATTARGRPADTCRLRWGPTAGRPSP